MKPAICNCNPEAHRVTTIDQKLLRRVRKDRLKDAGRWDSMDWRDAAKCARYTAYLCLLRLRELRNQ